MDRVEHNIAVNEFLKGCQQREPERYAAVCEKYPVIGARQWRRIREREKPFSAEEFEELYAADTRLDQED